LREINGNKKRPQQKRPGPFLFENYFFFLVVFFAVFLAGFLAGINKSPPLIFFIRLALNRVSYLLKYTIFGHILIMKLLSIMSIYKFCKRCY